MCKIMTSEKRYFHILYNGVSYMLGTVTLRMAEQAAHRMVRDYTRIKWSDKNIRNVETEAFVMAGKKRMASVYAYKNGIGSPTTIVHL